MPELKLSIGARRLLPACIRSRRGLSGAGLVLLALLAGNAAAASREDPMTALLAGEFALQAGQLGEATDWYLDAARALREDTVLAERATRIALLANDDRRAAQALRLWRGRGPDSLAMRAAAATLELRQGRLGKARRELEGLLRSPDPQGWRHARLALGGGRDPARIARVLDQLVDAGAIPDELAAWTDFGRLAIQLDDDALKRKILDQLTLRFPDEPRVALLKAGQLRQAGQVDQAMALLLQVESAAATDLEVRGLLAMAYESIREFSRAERVVALGPQDASTYGVRASLLARADDRERLGALYQELGEDAARPDPARRLLLGRMAEFLGRTAEAVDWYRGVPGGPQRIEARTRIAVALHELGRKDEAFEQARALQDDAALPDQTRRDAYLLEAELRQRDQADEAELDALDRGLAAWPGDTALLYARGLAWERRDRIDRAEADLRRLLALDPENVAALNALGYTLADRTTRYQEALELIDRARVAEPDNAAIVDSYGWVLYRLGRKEDALVELRRAWSLMKDPEVAAHVGEVLWVLGRKDEAQRFFDEAWRLDPENRALRRVLEQFGLAEPSA
jgi:tetratricopeptide (TPR) repeat protein